MEPLANELVELVGKYNFRFCCLSLSYNHYHIISDEADWWLELNFKCRQQTNVCVPLFLSCHNLKVFALPQSGQDIYCASTSDVRMNY